MKEIRIEFGKDFDDWEKSFTDSATMKWVVAGNVEGKKVDPFADLRRREKRSLRAFFAGIVAPFKLDIQVMQALVSTTYHIDVALLNNPNLLSKGRKVQMNTLIVKRIKRIARIGRFVSTMTFALITYPTLIVIDGLDDISSKDVQTDIIKLIDSTMKEVRPPLRFLVARRSKPHIVDATNILRSQFSEGSISIMESKEVPYTSLAYHSPEERLEVIQDIFEKPPGDEPYQNPDELYTHVVRKANHRADMLRIMALIIVIDRLIAASSAPASTFAQLRSPRKLDDILGLRRGDTRRCLQDMHSVVCVGDDDCDVHIHRETFSDFLLDPSRSNEFAVNAEDAYDRLFSHLIGTSRYRDTILQIIGQCLVSEGMNSIVDIIGSPANTSSSNRIETILGLKHGTIPKILTDIRLLVEVRGRGRDIKIQNPIFRSFLLDRSRSQGFFLDLDDARLTLKFAAPIRKVFGAKGM